MRSFWSAPIWAVIMSVSHAADEAPCAGCGGPEAIAVQATYTGELWHQASGGISRGSRYLDNLDLTVDLDAERAFGIAGLQFFGYALYNNGHVLCDELTGAIQCVSNIEANNAVRLYELWTEWRFDAGAQSVRLGLYDLNSEFDSIETAGLFINPSHGIGPDLSQTGEHGPSIFPVTGLGVRTLRSAGPWTIRAAAIDGVPGDPAHPDRTAIELSRRDGALLITEVNYGPESGIRVGAGYWRYTADFDDLSTAAASGEPQRRDDNAGAYLLFESPALLAREGRQLQLFLRTGQAESRINPIDAYGGAGAVYTVHAAPGARHDVGAAVAIARLGAPFRRAQAAEALATAAAEYNYELTYRFRMSDSFMLQSDVQYIDPTGTAPRRGAGWIVGLRFEFSQRWAR